MADGQAAVIDFLADPRTHDLAADAVRRIDTHGAVVFLAGPRAYKIKRAVKLPYLDFSTLEKRKAALEAEIVANRPFAPELYEGLVPITLTGQGKLALRGKGQVAEWALLMRRFDENATLDRLAERGGIDDTLARALGEAVALAHAKAPRFESAFWIEALGRFVDDETTAIFAEPDIVPRSQAMELGERLRAGLARIAPLLFTRGDAGHIRRGHGDLHLRNVALIDGKPVLFDALEFDPVVAAGDVLYDLAFLLMDLLARKLDRASNIVFNRYLLTAKIDQHLDALTALPFFLALRAAIRARVALDKGKLVQGRDRLACGSEARDYVTVALELAAPPTARLVAVGGLSGTGKTSVATGLAPAILPAPGAVHLRSDVERKRLANVGEFERLPASAYTEEASARTYATLNDLARHALAAGHSVLVDAVFARSGERTAIEAVARETGVKFEGVWLDLSLQERVNRVGARRNDASDADAEIVRTQERYDLGEIRWHRIDAAGTPEAVVKRARGALAH
jgi:aminoglycoside phosphotransferase family enzyme/predicted kinase